MIKQSNFLRWAQNNRNSAKSGLNKSWVHPPEALQQGHVVYVVKFLGNIEVDQAKGIDVIKDGIRKLKFSQQLKKAEGAKTPKVEVTISIDGVAIQDPKTKQISHQYPLHRISYCANDKSDKKFFSFIAKEEGSDTHRCFVFASDRLAEDITLTIGEAFDLAYRRFLDTSGKDLETKKQLMILQKKVQELEKENAALKQKLSEMTPSSSSQHVNLLQRNGVETLPKSSSSTLQTHIPPIPPRSLNANFESMPPCQDLLNLDVSPTVGPRLQNLVIDDLEDFDPRGDSILTNGSREKNGPGNNVTDVFGATIFNPTPNTDPFGMGDFSNMCLKGEELENAIGELDKRLSEMRDGFSRGISFGKEDFFESTEFQPNRGQ